MLYIVITLGVVLNISVWAMVYAEAVKLKGIEAAEARRQADFQARWSWDITQEPYYPELKARCDESRRLIAEYLEKHNASHKGGETA